MLRLLFLLGCLVIPLRSFGLCPYPVPRPCTAYFQSRAAFVGTVVSIENVVSADGEFIDGYNYRLRVQRWFKGKGGKYATVFTGNDSGREILEKGKTYLVFAYPGSRDYPHPLVIGCDDTAELPQRLADVEKTERLRSTRHTKSEITGFVGAAVGAEPLQGAEVTIRGAGKRRIIRTDASGRFQLTVSPGTYSVRVKAPNGKSVPAYEIQQDNPERLHLRAGQCADLAFVGP